MARKPTDEVQLKLRFSERLRKRLERHAAQNGRSMNAEIIHRLEHSFNADPNVLSAIARMAALETIKQWAPLSDIGKRYITPDEGESK